MKSTTDKYLSVLIAEDDPIMQELLQQFLTENVPGIKITLVPDGAKAVHFLNTCPQEERPGVILLDYNMPLMTGEEVLRKIYGDDRYNAVPKIILSSWVHPERLQNCVALGMTKFLTKPASFSEFNTLVKEIISLPIAGLQAAELPK